MRVDIPVLHRHLSGMTQHVFNLTDPIENGAKQWQADFAQLDRFTPALRHFSIFLPIAINNIRMVPQQGLLTISNVDDIEGYIAEHERARANRAAGSSLDVRVSGHYGNQRRATFGYKPTREAALAPFAK
jgi:hypothetical protein